MTINFDIYSLNENKIIFSHSKINHEEIHFDYFSLKFFNHERIIITIQDKKMIVLLNEVFQINHFQYVIFNSKEKINLLKTHAQNEDKFEHIILGQIQLFIFQYIKNFFSIFIISKKFLYKYVKNACLFLFIFLFLTKNEIIQSDKNVNRKSLQRQRNIYNTYHIISKEALPEIISLEDKPIQNKINSSSLKMNVYKDKPVLKLKIKSQKLKNEDDPEIQFFLRLKERK